jgi:hypothetical protein
MVLYRAVSKYTCMMLHYVRYDALHQHPRGMLTGMLESLRVKKLACAQVKERAVNCERLSLKPEANMREEAMDLEFYRNLWTAKHVF